LDLLPGEVDVGATLGVGVGVVPFCTVFALLDPYRMYEGSTHLDSNNLKLALSFAAKTQ
jgi:hypothetical protein